MDLVASSTIVRKYLKPSWVALAKGPHTSQWIKSKAWLDKWLELGKCNLLCFAIGQTTHYLFEWKKGTSDIQCWSFASETCPNLRCDKWGLVTIGICEIEWAKHCKTNFKIVEASDIDLQFDKACSRYRLLWSLPNPIIFQQVRSCMKQ